MAHKKIYLAQSYLYTNRYLSFSFHFCSPLFVFYKVQFFAVSFPFFFRNVQSRTNHFVHVVVFVLSEPATEDYVRTSLRKLQIALVECGILLVIDGVVGLHALFPFGGILITDHGFRLRTELEMFMLDDARIGCLSVRIVHDGYSLIVGCVKHMRVESDRAVLELSKLKTKELVNHPRIHGFARDIGVLLDKLKIIGVCLYVRALEHFSIIGV